MTLKTYKPTTPGRRQMTSASFEELTKGKKPEKRLLSKKVKRNGRSHGKISVRHRGGGHARRIRIIDFKRNDKLNIPGKVSSVEYDPMRTAYLMLVTYVDGEKRYHLAPEGIKVDDAIICGEKTKVKSGNRMMLENVPVGFRVYNIEMSAGKGGQLVKSAGSSAKVVSLEGPYAQIQLPSKEVRYINKKCFVTIGSVSNEEHSNIKIGKAGRTRWKGIRPTVRGKAKNPCDHPHGGGEGNQPIGLKHPKTPWGAPALGFKTRRRKYTNKWIVKDRRRK